MPYEPVRRVVRAGRHHVQAVSVWGRLQVCSSRVCGVGWWGDVIVGVWGGGEGGNSLGVVGSVVGCEDVL